MPVQIFFDCTEREDGPLRSPDQGASLAVLVHDYDEHVLKYVAVCCSVLQCVVVCCSVLQCVALMCCSVF